MDIQKRKKGKRIHSKDNIDSAASALVGIAKEKKGKFKSEEAIREIKKSVLAARSHGATWAEIAQTVQEAGLDVALSTLRKICRAPAAAPAPAAVAPKKAPVAAPAGGSLGDRLRAERAAASSPVAAPPVHGVAETSQVKMDGKGGFEIRPMVDDI